MKERSQGLSQLEILQKCEAIQVHFVFGLNDHSIFQSWGVVVVMTTQS